MNRKPLISVLLPVYNTEDYLPAALQSVLSQSYENIEIIVVNDDTPNRQKLDQVKEQFKKARVPIQWIRQEHSGLFAARRRAVELAQGEYILFLDSDDLIAPENLLEVLVENADETCSAYKFNMKPFEDASALSPLLKPHLLNFTLSGDKLLRSYCGHRRPSRFTTINTSLCSYLWAAAPVKRAYIEQQKRLGALGHSSTSLVFLEDYLITDYLFSHGEVDSVQFFDVYGHLYRQRQDSTSHLSSKQRDLKRLVTQLRSAQIVLEVLDEEHNELYAKNHDEQLKELYQYNRIPTFTDSNLLLREYRIFGPAASREEEALQKEGQALLRSIFPEKAPYYDIVETSKHLPPITYRLSLVIPFHNNEKDLTQLLGSFLEADDLRTQREEVQVVLVNDQSSTPEEERQALLAPYKDQLHIKTVNNSANVGSFWSRVNGVAHSSGEYVWIVDPDDLIMKNAYDHIRKAITSCPKDDTLHFKVEMRRHGIIMDYYSNHLAGEKTSYRGEAAPLVAQLNNHLTSTTLWASVLRRDLVVKNIAFAPKEFLTLADDLLLLILMLLSVRRSSIHKAYIYQYNKENEESITLFAEGRDSSDQQKDTSIRKSLDFLRQVNVVFVSMQSALASNKYYGLYKYGLSRTWADREGLYGFHNQQYELTLLSGTDTNYRNLVRRGQLLTELYPAIGNILRTTKRVTMLVSLIYTLLVTHLPFHWPANLFRRIVYSQKLRKVLTGALRCARFLKKVLTGALRCARFLKKALENALKKIL